MKKVFMMLVALFIVIGCTPVEETGDYKEGTYFNYAADDYGNSNSVAIAVVHVGKNGKIDSVFLDTTYIKNEIATTKKTLGDDYNMKGTSANLGVIPGGAEWYEQVEVLEEKVITEQGLDWLVWSDDEKTTTDSVSGVTMKINVLYEALEKALNQAKK